MAHTVKFVDGLSLNDAFKDKNAVNLPFVKECFEECFFKEFINLASQNSQHGIDRTACLGVAILLAKGTKELVSVIFTHEKC